MNPTQSGSAVSSPMVTVLICIGFVAAIVITWRFLWRESRWTALVVSMAAIAGIFASLTISNYVVGLQLGVLWGISGAAGIIAAIFAGRLTHQAIEAIIWPDLPEADEPMDPDPSEVSMAVQTQQLERPAALETLRLNTTDFASYVLNDLFWLAIMVVSAAVLGTGWYFADRLWVHLEYRLNMLCLTSAVTVGYVATLIVRWRIKRQQRLKLEAKLAAKAAEVAATKAEKARKQAEETHKILLARLRAKATEAGMNGFDPENLSDEHYNQLFSRMGTDAKIDEIMTLMRDHNLLFEHMS